MPLTDATRSLCRLLQPLLPDGASVFSGSLAHWPAAVLVQPSGLGLYLHRIEEVPTGLGGDWYDVRDDAGRVVARGGPARRFRLGYLLWAWSEQDPAEELRLLGDALGLLAGHPHLPAWCLSGPLAAGGPTRLTLAPEGQTAADGVWSAAGLAPRTTLHVALAADLLPDPVAPAPLVRERDVRTRTSAARPGGAYRGGRSG
ncbi:DUF4255 domain-containing protein [Streptomyces bambusae]|uniref:Pvc16 family protein n=1 Tax=Streptomyces bambusae TaxID=1550616 RepID=UPI001CFE0403|nr:Pvc16 family protein [Streptomyces bambusae]MCB5164588.1 DUF4255 domain-containing protein [Streptomyces bambusae]